MIIRYLAVMMKKILNTFSVFYYSSHKEALNGNIALIVLLCIKLSARIVSIPFRRVSRMSCYSLGVVMIKSMSILRGLRLHHSTSLLSTLLYTHGVSTCATKPRIRRKQCGAM